MSTKTYLLPDEKATISVGTALANIVKKELKKGIVTYLNGGLGAGKTTLSRGFVQAMGHKGNVKSPTYTLVEPYELGEWQVFHFDLYRLSDPEELEFMGIREYFTANSCCLVEWPKKGEGVLASADFTINLSYVGEQRSIELVAVSNKGEQVLALLDNYLKL